MKSIKIIATVFFLIGVTMNAITQSEDVLTQEYTVTQLHEDFEVFRTEFETMHAGLYIYTPKAEMDAAFDDIKNSITEPMTAPAFYNRLTKMNKFIKNGHTVIRPSAIFDEKVATEWKVFPFDVHWSGDSLFVLRNMSNDQCIQDGSYIKSINGEAADQVFKSLADNWNRDGLNTTFPEGIAARAFAEFYANQKGLPEKFYMEIISPEGKEELMIVSAIPGAERSNRRTKKYGEIHHYWQKGMGDALTLNIKDETAILTLKHCGNTDVRKFMSTIKGQYKRAFEKINKAGVENLIIDIRNNPGGNEKPTIHLMRHLVDKPFRLYEEDYLINRKVSKYYTSNRGYYNLLGGLVLNKDSAGLYRPNIFAKLLFGDGDTKFNKPAKTQFKGQIYTLTNYATFSAGGYLASMLEQHTNSIFVGEEPGGNANECVAGQYFDLELPNTKNRVLMQVVHSKIVVDRINDGHGVKPDYPIRPTVFDVINKRDPELELIYRLINNNDTADKNVVVSTSK